MTYPEDCIQSIISPSKWWIKNDENKICRGALIYACVPHVDQIPYMFIPIGRKEANNHHEATVKVTQLKINQPLKQVPLPVAAMPNMENEVWAAYRAKKRPCLVLRSNFTHVDPNLKRGKPRHSTAPTITIAPYYGADENGQRSGYTQAFRQRVMHCEYPQFLWDKLPTNNQPKESILRLDHIMPYGANTNSYNLSSYKLSEDAIKIIDDLLIWNTYGGIPEESIIIDYQTQIQAIYV